MRALHGCSATSFLSIPQFPGYAVHVADDVIAATAEVFLNGRIVLPGMKSPDGTFRRCRSRPDDSIVRLWINPQGCLCSWSSDGAFADNYWVAGLRRALTLICEVVKPHMTTTPTDTVEDCEDDAGSSVDGPQTKGLNKGAQASSPEDAMA